MAVPYAWGKAEGNLADQAQEISRSGPCDMRLRLAANLLGGPALSPREFATRTPATTLGASLLVIAPTGQYDPARMINLGMHRWAAKPELGLSHPAGPWTLELTGGVWFFAPNLDYYQGQRRAQDPLLSVQGHACYTFRPRLWLALSSTYYAGGRVFLDGEPSDTRLFDAGLGQLGDLGAQGRRGQKDEGTAAHGCSGETGKGGEGGEGGQKPTFTKAWRPE